MLLRDIVKKYITRRDTVLDLCCGIGYAFMASKWGSLIGIDIHEAYLCDFKKNLKDVSVVQGDVRYIDNLIQGQFDIITCFDAVEHFSKEEALQLIDWMKIRSRKCVIVLTPKDLVNNTKSESWQGGDEHQEHKCCFGINEMCSMDFSMVHYFKKHNNVLYRWK